MIKPGDRLFGKHTIITDGAPYMTRYWFGRLRLHVFYRGDIDPDCHDHPWDFWTFPLTSYVEEVIKRREQTFDYGSGAIIHPPLVTYESCLQVVPAFRLSFRPAAHTHRVLGPYAGFNVERYPVIATGKIVTLVWHSAIKRRWGFLKNRNGEWCWIAWKNYVFDGGKEGPC